MAAAPPAGRRARRRCGRVGCRAGVQRLRERPVVACPPRQRSRRRARVEPDDRLHARGRAGRDRRCPGRRDDGSAAVATHAPQLHVEPMLDRSRVRRERDRQPTGAGIAQPQPVTGERASDAPQLFGRGSEPATELIRREVVVVDRRSGCRDRLRIRRQRRWITRLERDRQVQPAAGGNGGSGAAGAGAEGRRDRVLQSHQGRAARRGRGASGTQRAQHDDRRGASDASARRGDQRTHRAFECRGREGDARRRADGDGAPAAARAAVDSVEHQQSVRVPAALVDLSRYERAEPRRPAAATGVR